ncbi:protein kinase C-binding protein 1-like [Contarinia nasturtii]|uniref:protein kinase C-binding protein 1-like n=1 Tax=Contarinia nasturtii TaxID=265458 RepID=UPI0012D3ABC5|nr:protein kinase C-binding protein 1-like [Contarinia nasturtii]
MRTKDFGETTKKLFKEGKMSRKRAHRQLITESSGSEDSAEPVPPKITRAWDAYCWICHVSNAKHRCSTCIRSYHSRCIGTKEADHKSGYRCELCVRLEAAENDYIKRGVKMDHLHRMFELITDRLLKNDDFKRLGTTFSRLRKPVVSGPNIINPFDFNIISEKVKDLRYKTTLDFMTDIRWIRHNAEIVLNENDARLGWSRQLEEICEKEVYDVEMCGECFERANQISPNEWFTEVCNPPHCLVWVKLKGNPYWPAKVIAFADKFRSKIDVRFFGKHEMLNVATHDCFLYSENPNQNLNESERIEFDAAVKEADKYIENIEKKYSCTINRPLPTSIFNANHIGDHLTDMIPSPKLNLDKNYSLKTKPTYLRKFRRRKVLNSSALPAINSSMESKPNRLKDCFVRVERCDKMLNKEHIEFIRMMNSSYSGLEEASESQQSNDENDVYEDETEHIEADYTENTATKHTETEHTEQIETGQQAKGEQHKKQSNKYEMMIHLSAGVEPEIDSEPELKNINAIQMINNELVAIVISSDEEETEQERPNTTNETQISKEINAYSSPSSDDEEHSVFQNKPPARTYSKRNSVSSEQNTNKMLNSDSQTLVGRKSYGLLHRHYAVRKESIEDKTTDASHHVDPINKSNTENPQCNDSVVMPKVSNDFNREISHSDTETDNELMDMELEIPAPQPDSPLDHLLKSPTKEFHVEKIPESPSAQYTEEITTNAETEHQIEPEPESQQFDNNSPQTIENGAQSPDHNLHSNANIQSNEIDQSDIMPKANIEGTHNAESTLKNQKVVEQSEKLEHNEQIQQVEITSNQNSSAQKPNEIDSNVSSPVRTATPVQSTRDHESECATQAIQQNTTQANIQSVDELLKQTTTKIDQLESELKQKDKLIDELKAQNSKLMANHNVDVQNAIQETKNKNWCFVCKREAKSMLFIPPSCSKKCLHILWLQGIKENPKNEAN